MLQPKNKRAEIAAGLASLKLERKFVGKLPLERHERARRCKPARLIAYDLETTRIQAGTPRPLYITAYAPGVTHYAAPIASMQELHDILEREFLTEANKGAKFVAWNGNRFDAFIIAAALVRDPKYRLRPYLSRSKAMRGLRVTLVEDGDGQNIPGWEFLDGIAMLGLAGTSLEKFLNNFAPDFKKLSGTIDFEREEFDATNSNHCAYAMRDSVGLWHGMDRAQKIMVDTFNEPLAVTMGGVCIKVFKAHIPRGVVVDSLIPDLEEIVNTFVMRGGFCYCAQRYEGPIWKYDINQAYAAAMRDGPLPSGGVLYGQGKPNVNRPAYVVKIRAFNRENKIPFYYRTINAAGRVKSEFGIKEIKETWITSIEHRQLIAEGWRIDCFEHYSWAKSFDMREFVDKLETLRMNAEGGPSGPIGTMIKATGNHSYGKTVERVEPIEYVVAAECPDGFLPYYGDGSDPIEHIYWRFDHDRKPKSHHQPQIGAFITSNVRMVLRRAALLAPDDWLYADTDCVVFSSDVTARLDIDAKRYGAWKIEETGALYRIIAKKVYASLDGEHRSAKGLNVRRLTPDDFEGWFNGDAPVQDQTQLQHFFAVMRGAEMYRTQRRQGTRVETQKAARRAPENV